MVAIEDEIGTDDGRLSALRAPRRTCALSRTERAATELLRFVASPDGTLYPDIARKLPGRGVWITADRASVAAAARSGAFARSLKLKVKVPEDLAGAVEALLRRRVIEALALANKAGLVVSGFDKVDALIEREEIAALLHGSDSAPGGREKLDRKYRARLRDEGLVPEIIDLLLIDELGLAIGRVNVVHAGLKPGGAAQRFLDEVKRLVRYRDGFGASPAPVAGHGGEAATGPP